MRNKTRAGWIVLAFLVVGPLGWGTTPAGAQTPLDGKPSVEIPVLDAANALRADPRKLREAMKLNPKVPQDVGTKIKVDEKILADHIAIQKKFAEVMLWGDPRPWNRVAHFAWLYDTYTFQNGFGRQVGWCGRIESIQPIPGGTWRVRVQIRPVVYSTGIGLVTDYVTEEYLYRNGQVRLIESDAPIPKPGSQVFPVL